LAREVVCTLSIVESPLKLARIEEAEALHRSACRQGITIRSSVDSLIAGWALHHGLTVKHHDRDYAALARVSTLQQQGI